MSNQPFGNSESQERRPNEEMDGKINAFLNETSQAAPAAEAKKPDAWRSFVKGSTRVMNGASVVYTMARVFIGPTAMPPRMPGTSLQAPHFPTELPEKLPRPYRQGKPKGQKYAD